MATKVCLTEDLCVGEALKLNLLQKLDLLYSFYHKQWWCLRRMCYHFRLCNVLLNSASLLVMAIGMIVGSVFQNSIIVTILQVGGWHGHQRMERFKKFALKVDMSKFAFTTYEKALIELRTHMRGLPLEELVGFLINMQTLDKTISDFTAPITDRCSQTDHAMFVYVPLDNI